jgi:hypothetical protein
VFLADFDGFGVNWAADGSLSFRKKSPLAIKQRYTSRFFDRI